MIDADAVLRVYLAGKADLTALVGARLYASAELPAGYNVSQGPALLFATRGGGQEYSSRVLDPSYQFRAYAATEAAARQVDRVLFDVLNDAKAAGILSARLESFPVLLMEPETEWPFVLSFYRLMMTNP